jgi:predicted nucleic acid-binding protein
MYLLDTAIVYELRKAKAGDAEPGLAAWAGAAQRQNLFISALTLLELETGARKLERLSKATGQHVRTWIEEQVLAAFDGRVLPVDATVVRRAAQLGYSETRDGLLAATALEHGMTLVTRNTAAFRSGKVKLFNPAGYKPATDEDDTDWRQAARTSSLWLKNLFVRT